jgi:2-polyprenyl-3-methyl-5-hydroxy-6-metoxy-1,4-benzoquinol methylase
MIEKIIEYSKKPKVFEKSTSKFWDDEYISKQMLNAHLDKNFDAATRKEETVKKTVRFITEVAKKHDVESILDMGCGPGIYCEMFHKQGLTVSGLDLSLRSIEYARDIAEQNMSKIKYYNQNYLDIDIDDQFDMISLIYCDYGVLSKAERKILLNNIKKLLKPNGLFVFDVFTPEQYKDFSENMTYYYSDGPGFWSGNKHVCLESNYAYDDHIHLNQNVVLEDEKINVYRIWDEAFTKEKLTNELKENGFIVKDIYADLTGTAYTKESKMMGIVAYKK